MRRFFPVEQAPYVLTFPMVAAVIVMVLTGSGDAWWSAFLLGVLLGYHVFTVVSASWHDRKANVRADIRSGYWLVHVIWLGAGVAWWTLLAVLLATDGGQGASTLYSGYWDNLHP